MCSLTFMVSIITYNTYMPPYMFSQKKKTNIFCNMSYLPTTICCYILLRCICSLPSCKYAFSILLLKPNKKIVDLVMILSYISKQTLNKKLHRIYSKNNNIGLKNLSSAMHAVWSTYDWELSKSHLKSGYLAKGLFFFCNYKTKLIWQNLF